MFFKEELKGRHMISFEDLFLLSLYINPRIKLSPNQEPADFN